MKCKGCRAQEDRERRNVKEERGCKSSKGEDMKGRHGKERVRGLQAIVAKGRKGKTNKDKYKKKVEGNGRDLKIRIGFGRAGRT